MKKSYQLFDLNGKDVTHHDLQDKGVWCRLGASKEEVFVEKFGKALNLMINPEKKTNPYAPDLLNTRNHLLADLKTQNTPFFQAKSRFSMDPQYTVVFNGKDRERYREKYPEIEIYFALDWQIVRFHGSVRVEVKPMTGIWFIPFNLLDEKLSQSPFHAYSQRKRDQKGNAKGSYILDLQDPVFTKVK